MKCLFIGLGSISTKHIKDLYKILANRKIDLDISILRRKITPLSEELEKIKIKQITEMDTTVFDVAFITNPTNLHYDILQKLKGKAHYFFIEKPIFEKSDYDWKSLGNNEYNSYIACPMRHMKVYKELKKIVKANNVFNARIICSSYLPDWRPNIDYRKNYSAIKSLGGGVTLDLIHEMDYMVDLFGMPDRVLNIRGKYSNLEIDSDDLSIYIISYKDKLCEVHLDYFGKKYQRTCEIYTQFGTYIADFKDEVIKLPDGSFIDCKEPGKTDIYNEMEWFIKFILGECKDNLNPPDLAIKVLKISLGEY